MLVVVVMGVSGCGKSTIGPLLAAALGGAYADGDAFHPPANVAKMKSGQPLDDADRKPWLEAMAAAIADWSQRDRPTVLSCSALKRRYRDILRSGSPELRFVHLAGDKALIAARLAARKDHFMPAALLDSQFAALEPPGPDEAIIVSIDQPPHAIVAETVAKLAVVLSEAKDLAVARPENSGADDSRAATAALQRPQGPSLRSGRRQ